MTRSAGVSRADHSVEDRYGRLAAVNSVAE